MDDTTPQQIELFEHKGRLQLRMPGDEQAKPVKVIYLRPLTVRSEISFFDDDNTEMLTIGSVEELQPQHRELVQQRLDSRYHLPIIEQVIDVEITFGTQYWKVRTSKGNADLALKEPGKNVTWVTADHVVLRDTMGNRFEIPALSSLDTASKKFLRQHL